jgi:hypothetical protein
LLAHEHVAEMLVDHLIDFKGCRCHTRVMGEATGMKEFVEDRIGLLEGIPEFADPDFAQVERLPAEARLTDDENDEVEDDWRRFSKDPDPITDVTLYRVISFFDLMCVCSGRAAKRGVE